MHCLQHRAGSSRSRTRSSIDYYNAHGTSTILNDQVETQVVKDVFGDIGARLPISSIKGATRSQSRRGLGHRGGGLRSRPTRATHSAHDQLPPDPELDLDYVPIQARTARLDVVLSASFGFGGTNNALILRRTTS